MDARFRAVVAGVFLLAVAIGLLAAHRQSSTIAAPAAPTSTPTPIPPPAPNTVDIVPNPSDNAVASYNPATLVVRVGQKVTWVNTDTQDHTATADNGAFDTGVLSSGETKSWTPTKPGTYAYGCYIHPQVRGVIVVQP